MAIASMQRNPIEAHEYICDGHRTANTSFFVDSWYTERNDVPDVWMNCSGGVARRDASWPARPSGELAMAWALIAIERMQSTSNSVFIRFLQSEIHPDLPPFRMKPIPQSHGSIPLIGFYLVTSYEKMWFFYRQEP